MTDEESSNRIWQSFEQANREMMEQLERELVLAFYRGYDGVDEIVGSHEHGFGDDFKLRTVIHPWDEGDEPHRPPWASHHRRYDFDGVTYQDLRELHEVKHD